MESIYDPSLFSRIKSKYNIDLAYKSLKYQEENKNG